MVIHSIVQAAQELNDPCCPDDLDVILRVNGRLHTVKEHLSPEEALRVTIRALGDGLQVEVEEHPDAHCEA